MNKIVRTTNAFNLFLTSITSLCLFGEILPYIITHTSYKFVCPMSHISTFFTSNLFEIIRSCYNYLVS